jgi:hypothetical protein
MYFERQLRSRGPVNWAVYEQCLRERSAQAGTAR